jgi:hypothetical protein
MFRGKFSRETAERVADVSLSIICRLAEHSFLHRDEKGEFSIHKTAWQFLIEMRQANSAPNDGKED